MGGGRLVSWSPLVFHSPGGRPPIPRAQAIGVYWDLIVVAFFFFIPVLPGSLPCGFKGFRQQGCHSSCQWMFRTHGSTSPALGLIFLLCSVQRASMAPMERRNALSPWPGFHREEGKGQGSSQDREPKSLLRSIFSSLPFLPPILSWAFPPFFERNILSCFLCIFVYALEKGGAYTT